MSFSCTVTRGATATGNTVVDATFLNAGFTPVVTIDDGSLPADTLDGASFILRFGATFRSVNWLPWGAMNPDMFTAGTVACAAGKRTEPARQWFVLPAGAAVDAQLSARNSTNPAAEGGKTGMLVKGNAGLTALRFGTYVPPVLAGQLYGGNVTFSAHIWNAAGAAFTPSLEVSTSATRGDEGNVSLQTTVAGQSCANAAWTRVEFVIPANTLLNWQNGARLAIRITTAAGVLDVNTDYAIFADLQLDANATVASAFLGNAPVPSQFPAGTMFPYGGTVAPPGWLLCNGAEVSRDSEARLFGAIGTAYGPGDGATTFNLPDMRGRTLVGSEVAGASQSRMEVTLTALSSAADRITFATGVPAAVRIGMGVFHANIPAGATVLGITDKEVQISANTTASVSGDVRFSRLGAADAEVVGAAGNGMTAGRRLRKVVLPGNSGVTAASAVLTPAGGSEAVKKSMLAQIVPGMLIDDNAGGTIIPVGTTVLGFQFLSGPSTQIGRVVMSANASATNAAFTAGFTMRDPEGDDAAYTALKGDQIVLDGCNWGSGTTQLDVGDTSRLRAGMRVSSGTAGLPAGGYIESLTPGGSPPFVTLNAVTTAAGNNARVTFSGSDETRAPVAATADTLPAVTGNWIIKT